MQIVMNVEGSSYTSSEDGVVGACGRPAKWKRRSSIESHLQLGAEDQHPVPMAHAKNYMKPTISSLVKRKHRKMKSYDKPTNATDLDARLRVKVRSCLSDGLDLEALKKCKAEPPEHSTLGVLEARARDEGTPPLGAFDWSMNDSSEDFDDENYAAYLYPLTNAFLIASDDICENLPCEEPCGAIVCSVCKDTNLVEYQIVEFEGLTSNGKISKHPFGRLKSNLRKLGLKFKMSGFGKLLSRSISAGMKFFLQLLFKLVQTARLCSRKAKLH